MSIIGAPGLASAGYIVKKYEVRKTINYPISLFEIDGAWGRGAFSNGWSQSSPNLGERFCEVVPGTATLSGATLRTYVYQVWSITGSYLGYYPTSPSNVQFAYTVLGKKPPTINGPTLVCTSNATFALNDCPLGATVSWLHSNNLIYVSGQGTDNYTVKAANATIYGGGWLKAIVSTSSVSDTVEKEFLVGLPYPPVIIVYPFVQPNTLVNVTAASPGAESWDWQVSGGTIMSGQGTQNISVQTTTYCIDSLRLRVTVGNACGSQPQVENSAAFYCPGGGGLGGLSVSPNPASQTLTIEIEDSTSITTSQATNEAYTVQLFNRNNKPVYQRKEISKHFTINVSGYRRGIYYLRVTRANQVYVKKIVIVH